MKPAMRLLLTGLLLGETLAAQPFSRQISLTTDNDAYLFKRKDRYYTNGLFFRLDKITGKHARRISSWELGQMMYTPENLKIFNVADIDRAFCGYLYLQYSQASFHRPDEFFQWSITGGVVGKASLAEQFQDFLHHLAGLYTLSGWKYQVTNEVNLNGGASYARVLFPQAAISSRLQWIPVVEGNLGNAFINLKTGVYLRAGIFERLENSSLFHAGIGQGQTPVLHKYELFAYFHPQVTLQGYNATVQGGMFTAGDTSITALPKIMVYQQTFGIAWARNRWAAHVEVTYQTQESSTQKLTQRYASLQLGYRLR